MKIDVFFDPICPWCYIGAKRLEQSLALYQKQRAEGHKTSKKKTSKKTAAASIEIYWRMFQLNPSMPKSGMLRADYLRAKFGSPAVYHQVYHPIQQTAEKENITLNLDRIQVTPSTLEAHRLVKRTARTHDSNVTHKLVNRLFEAYFIDGADIGDAAVLNDLAAELMIKSSDDSTESDLEALKQDRTDAANYKISGVPYMVFNDSYSVSGAQPPHVLIPMLELAAQKTSQ